jgi:hypothetical protein
MTPTQGETAVTTSALVCSGLYVYRKATEKVTGAPNPSKDLGAPLKGGLKTSAEGVLGIGEILPTGPWLTGMGLTFIALSVLTSINAGFGGSMAILVATGAVLGNGQAAIKDFQGGLSGKAPAASKGKAEASQPLQLNQPPLKG